MRKGMSGAPGCAFTSSKNHASPTSLGSDTRHAGQSMSGYSRVIRYWGHPLAECRHDSGNHRSKRGPRGRRHHACHHLSSGTSAGSRRSIRRRGDGPATGADQPPLPVRWIAAFSDCHLGRRRNATIRYSDGTVRRRTMVAKAGGRSGSAGAARALRTGDPPRDHPRMGDPRGSRADDSERHRSPPS